MTKKLSVNTLALGNLRTRKKQYTMMIVGIVLAMIFTSGVPFFISCSRSSQTEIRERRQGKQDYIVVNAQIYDFAPMIEQGAVDADIGYCHVLSYAWNGNDEKTDFSDGTMIGWLDERATELYYPQIIEGIMPEKEGEIILEKSALTRMRLDVNLGDKITLKSLTCNEQEFILEDKEKTYTLVGIMDDKKAYIENMNPENMEKVSLVPAAFVAENTKTDIGGKEALVAFVNETHVPDSLFWNNITYEDRIQTDYVSAISIGDAYSNVSSSTSVSVFLSLLLAFLSCFGIVNTLNSNLKERKAQVGMLKAVGATRRQIINIFGREAFIICIITAPLSVVISYGAVKLFAKLMGDSFIFKPDITVLLLGVLFGIICVMLSSLIPLISISKLSPMQAIRDVELMRKMKNKKIKSKKQFNVSSLLAKRKLTFSQGRQAAVCIIIALSVVICCMSMTFLYTTVSNTESFYASDYEVINYGQGGSSNHFINSLQYSSGLNENSRNEIYDIPYVANVYGTKELNVNLLIEGEYPEYLEVVEYASFINTSSRFENSISGQTDLDKVTEENIKECMQAEPNEHYLNTKKAADITKGELFNTSFTAKSEALLDFEKEDIIDGEINFERINEGKEVIICAPEEIGFYCELMHGGGFSWGLLNLSDEAEDETTMEKLMKGNVKATAKSPFKAGDTLKLCLLTDDGNGNIIREDREVKIGAIVGKKNSTGHFGIYTTLEGLNKFNTKFDYRHFDVQLKEECTAEIDSEMQSQLSAMFPGKNIGSTFAMNEANKQEMRTVVLSVSALVLVMLFVCISLINNSVSAQIREGKRFIGTLRAVGASQRELTLSYLLQIADMLLWGFGTGTVVYIISYTVLGKIMTGEYFPVVLWPAFVVFGIIALCCFINLKTKIRTVTKHSIVENIRELG